MARENYLPSSLVAICPYPHPERPLLALLAHADKLDAAHPMLHYRQPHLLWSVLRVEPHNVADLQALGGSWPIHLRILSSSAPRGHRLPYPNRRFGRTKITAWEGLERLLVASE